MPPSTTSYTVTSVGTPGAAATTLNGAIGSIDLASASDAVTGVNYTITLANSIALGTTALEAINLQSSLDTLSIIGGGFTLSASPANLKRGLFVYAGNVTVSNLTVTGMRAVGGAGVGGGAGGAGLGGGLFVGANAATDPGNVTLNNVVFTNDGATGGNGGAGVPSSGGGGGGGLGGAGKAGSSGGGGGGGVGGAGGLAATAGSRGIIPGAGAGGVGGHSGGAGGASGGGGGGGAQGTGNTGGGGGGVGSVAPANGAGGAGGFGGGGGGGDYRNDASGGAGGFGGGGGGGGSAKKVPEYGPGGAGGFGGGGGGGGGAGGFGGGGGANPGSGVNGAGGAGGGGLGAGGDIFVQSGASLTIENSTTATTAGTVNVGAAGAATATAGKALGAGIYSEGGSLIFNALGSTETLAAPITDDKGAATAAGYTYTGTYAPKASVITIVGTGGSVILSGVNTYTGGTTISTATTLEISTIANIGSGAVGFGAAASTLRLDTTPASGSTFADKLAASFNTLGSIDFPALTYVAGASAVASGPTLTLTDNGTTEIFNLATPSANFYALPDGSTGTILTSIACYCPGAMILTPRGEVAIENLAIGDEVFTASGTTRPIKWIARRRYGGRFLKANENLHPVMIRADALADGVPNRDLLVSPLHAMFLDGVFVTASALVNGATIVRAAPGETLEYVHLELDDHDVVIANGAASESYVDDGDRLMFHNAASYFEIYPNEEPTVARYFAPRVTGGHALEAIRARIERRAGVRAARETAPLRGFIDHVGETVIEGWAQNSQNPNAPVCLDILVDGVVVAQTLANLFRSDLAAAGIAVGRHGFSVKGDFARGSVEVRRSSDGAALPPPARVAKAA